MIIAYSWLDGYQVIGIESRLSYFSMPESEVARGSPSYTDPLQASQSYTDPLQASQSYTDPLQTAISYE